MKPSITITESKTEPYQSTPGWAWVVFWILAVTVGVGSCKQSNEAKKTALENTRRAVAAIPAPVVEYPISGEGHATKEVGLKVWLDPMKTSTRTSRAARHVFVEDPAVFYEHDEVTGEQPPEKKKQWEMMPKGKYLVYPLTGDRIFFQWSQ